MRIIIEVDAVNNTATTTTDHSDNSVVKPSATIKTIDAGAAAPNMRSSGVETNATASDMLSAHPNAQSAGAAPNF
jgi:hypothetical protein